MQDRPTYSELLEAIQHFLEVDVTPALDGPKKFHARVAANVLAIVRRELEHADVQAHAEWIRLNALLGSNDAPPTDRRPLTAQLRARTEELCRRIRAGEADGGAWRQAVLAHVRQTVVDKLRIANPKFVADVVAKARGGAQ